MDTKFWGGQVTGTHIFFLLLMRLFWPSKDNIGPKTPRFDMKCKPV